MTPRVNPKVSYKLWVIMTYQYKSIRDKKCTTLISDVNNEVMHVWTGEYRPLNFAINLKLL